MSAREGVEIRRIKKCLAPLLTGMTVENAVRWLEDPFQNRCMGGVNTLDADPFKSAKLLESIENAAQKLPTPPVVGGGGGKNKTLHLLRRAFFSGAVWHEDPSYSESRWEGPYGYREMADTQDPFDMARDVD